MNAGRKGSFQIELCNCIAETVKKFRSLQSIVLSIAGRLDIKALYRNSGRFPDQLFKNFPTYLLLDNQIVIFVPHLYPKNSI